MKMEFRILVFILILVLGHMISFAQEEEESAEIFLEEYTDQFQEVFFEALKQKGIENYDRAVNLLLECKQMDPENTVLDYELAKIYLIQKNFVSALEYSLTSVTSEPENFWYLNTLIDILKAQGRSVAELKERISYENESLKENLALIYYNRRDYNAALLLLKEIEDTSFSQNLSSKIKDSLDLAAKAKANEPREAEVKSENPLDLYRERLEKFLAERNYDEMEILANEALELFPSQPYYYYMLGKALAMNNKPREASRVLESALDFVLDNNELSNNIYRELSNAYKALGDLNKANMYLSKIKNGS